MGDTRECPALARVEKVEDAIKTINSSCCSAAQMEQRVKTNILLEQLIIQVEALEKEIKVGEEKNKIQYSKLIEDLRHDQEELKEAQGVYQRYLHYAAGAIAVLYFFGIDDKIKAILGG